MQFSEKLRTIIEKSVIEFGYEFFGFQMASQSRGSILRIFVDSSTGITVGELQKISQYIDGVLAVEFPDMLRYTLEVSSPGVDRLLFSLAHYQKYLGRRIKVKFFDENQERRNVCGVLKKAENEAIQLELESPQEIIDVKFSSIDKARLVPEL